MEYCKDMTIEPPPARSQGVRVQPLWAPARRMSDGQQQNTYPGPVGPPTSHPVFGDEAASSPTPSRQSHLEPVPEHRPFSALVGDPSELRAQLQPARLVKPDERWRRWLRMGPSQRTVERIAEDAAIRASLPAPVTVVVAQPKGGSGKTPLTIGLASALASARPGDVLALDNNEMEGTLGLRVTSQHNRTIGDLLQRLDWLQARPDSNSLALRWCAHWQEVGFHAVASSPDASPITGEQFTKLREVIARYFPILLVDTGNSMAAANWRAAIDSADVIVIPLQLKEDHIALAARLVSEFRHQGIDVSRRVVIVTSNGRVKIHSEAAELARAWFSGSVTEFIPYDPVIADESVIVWSDLHKQTQLAYRRLAARVVPMAIAAQAARKQQARTTEQVPINPPATAWANRA